MSSFFESLNFQPAASGSGTRSSAASNKVRSPRQAASSSATRISRDTTNHNELENSTRVFWAAPPSTFVQNWRANNPPQAVPAAIGDDDEGPAGDQARQLLMSAAAADQGRNERQDHRWSRQQSNSSTSSTTSSKSTNSRPPRRIKSLRASKAEGGFRRHVSSSAAISKSIYEDEDSSSQLDSDDSSRRRTGSIRRGQSGTRVQRLLADLSLRVQQIDREDEDQGQDEFDEGDLTVLLDCVDESSPCGKGFDPPSSGTVKLSPPKRSIMTSSWERAVTFPPTGSPAASTDLRAPAGHFATPLGAKGMEQPTTAFEDRSDDGFDLELDESLLLDLPMLSGKADSGGFFDRIAREEDITAMSTPSPPSLTAGELEGAVQQQALPTPQASPSSVDAVPNRSLTALGKRRDPPTPGGSSDTQEESSGMATRRQTNSNRSNKARSTSPTKPHRGAAAAIGPPRSSLGTATSAAAKLEGQSFKQMPSDNGRRPTTGAGESRPLASSATSPKKAPGFTAIPAAQSRTSPSKRTATGGEPSSVPAEPAAAGAEGAASTRAVTRQSSRSPHKQQRKASSTSATSTSSTSTVGSTSLLPLPRKTYNSTIPKLSQGTGGRRPGLSRGSLAGVTSGFKPPTRVVPLESLLSPSSPHQDMERSTSSNSSTGHERGEKQWNDGGENNSFEDDDIAFDAEELDKVMSAKGY